MEHIDTCDEACGIKACCTCEEDISDCLEGQCSVCRAEGVEKFETETVLILTLEQIRELFDVHNATKITLRQIVSKCQWSVTKIRRVIDSNGYVTGYVLYVSDWEEPNPMIVAQGAWCG